ncbi:ankyrin-3-like [Schistocerca piceifrons]|uniref:ankyrin-3-like n=1 Tax=Schistocerca piceifrons TaxID=274613 RepID=UPI001F5E530A|nr:ankyrin-3-like [Schistocerca piceifrons]
MYANDSIRVLHAAVRAGNLQHVTEMLAKGADIEGKDSYKVRPVHIAAERGHLDVLRALIARGCSVNAKASHPVFKQQERDVTSLHLATGIADPNVALALIAAGANVNAKTSSGTSPLQLAAIQGHLSVVKALVSANANVNSEDNVKVTPLCAAVSQNFEDVAKFLVQNGAIVNARHSDGLTPLHIAAQYGYVNIAKLLLQNKAEINAKHEEGFTALHLAVENRHGAVSQLLINSGADVNARDKEGGTPLHNAAYSGYPIETVRLLIEKGASVNARDKAGRTPLHLAAESDFTEAVSILIRNKAYVNIIGDQMTPLHGAACKGNLDSIKILIANGAVVDRRTHRQNTPLHLAAYFWHAEVVKYLLEQGAEVNATDGINWTPLHFAGEESSTQIPFRNSRHTGSQAQDSKLNTMKALIEYGADVNAKGSNYDDTPLHVAVRNGDTASARCLLENGAYYDAKYKFASGNVTASEMAATRRNENVNTLLCATEKLFKAVKSAKCAEIEKCVKEAPVNSGSIKYGTPLMYACWKGHLAVANVLLKNGANINLSNSSGITPLHYAAKFGHHEILCTLLQHGAVYNARTKTGKKTPLNFAQEEGKQEVTDTLKLIERLFTRIGRKDNTVLKELNGLKNNKYAEFLAIINCKNANKETLTQIASKNGYEELCNKFSDL